MRSCSDPYAHSGFAKIVTVTANTAIDYVLEIDNLKLGDIALAQRSYKFAAGKGVNVAKAVASLDCAVQVLGFVGNRSAALFQGLNSELISIGFIQVNGEPAPISHCLISTISRNSH